MGADEGEINDTSTPIFVENIKVNSKARLVDTESNLSVTGPSELKPAKLKSTWTRIMRMDYGLVRFLGLVRYHYWEREENHVKLIVPISRTLKVCSMLNGGR